MYFQILIKNFKNSGFANSECVEYEFTFGDVQFFSDDARYWEKYWALQNAIDSANWTDMELRNKFQYVVNVAGGNMSVNCYGPGGHLVSAKIQIISVS